MRLAAIQMSMAVDTATNIDVAERLVRDAAAQGAHVVVIPELFEGHYFCRDQSAEELQRARPLDGNPTTVTFYGSSFITDATGEKVAEAGRDDECVLVAEIDVEANRAMRAAWGLFRDRRPELYGALTTLDGARTSFDGANETPRR